MKINDVVTWYDMYLEQIVKDSGLGSIVEIDCYTTDGYEQDFTKFGDSILITIFLFLKNISLRL